MRARSTFMDNIRDRITLASDSVISNLSSRVQREAFYIADAVEERLAVAQTRMVRQLGASILMGLSVLSLLGAGMFFMVDQLGLSRAAGFLTFGVALFIIGMVIRSSASRRKRQWRQEYDLRSHERDI